MTAKRGASDNFPPIASSIAVGGARATLVGAAAHQPRPLIALVAQKPRFV